MFLLYKAASHQAIHCRMYEKKTIKLYDFLFPYSEIWPDDGCLVSRNM